MAVFRHIFVIVFAINLLLFIVIVINKQVLHFKLLKEIYPRKLSKINSYLNPLAAFYLFGLSISDLLWFSSPIYYKKKDIIIQDNLKSNYEKKLIANNKRIYISLIIFCLWLFLGIIIISLNHS